MAKATIAAAMMFTVRERELGWRTAAPPSDGVGGDGGGSGGEKLLVWKREREDEQAVSFNYESIGGVFGRSDRLLRCVRPDKWPIKKGTVFPFWCNVPRHLRVERGTS